MPRVFISYRREDSAPYAGRLHDRLVSEFGPRSVFMDLDSIDPGENFDARIRSALARTDVVLALIGQQWLTRNRNGGTPRIWSANDYVRREITLALESGVLVIPTLVGSAELPEPDALPMDIRQLVALQAVDLSDARWNQDAARLIEVIDRAAPHAGGWMRTLRSQTSRKHIAWVLRAVIPLLTFGAAGLVLRAFRVDRNPTLQLALILLAAGCGYVAVNLVDKYFGTDRLNR